MTEIHILIGNTLISRFYVGFEIEMPLNDHILLKSISIHKKHWTIENIKVAFFSVFFLPPVEFSILCMNIGFVFAFSRFLKQVSKIKESYFFKGFDKHQQNVLQNRYQIINLKLMKLLLKYKYLPTYAYVGSMLILFRMLITIRKKRFSFTHDRPKYVMNKSSLQTYIKSFLIYIYTCLIRRYKFDLSILSSCVYFKSNFLFIYHTSSN